MECQSSCLAELAQFKSSNNSCFFWGHFNPKKQGRCVDQIVVRYELDVKWIQLSYYVKWWKQSTQREAGLQVIPLGFTSSTSPRIHLTCDSMLAWTQFLKRHSMHSCCPWWCLWCVCVPSSMLEHAFCHIFLVWKPDISLNDVDFHPKGVIHDPFVMSPVNIAIQFCVVRNWKDCSG